MIMKLYRALSTLLALTGLVALGGVVSGQAPPSNVIRHTTRADLVPQAGPLEIVQLTIDFVPGAASNMHYHSGVAHTTVLAGAITVRTADGDQQVGVGESWTDAPGAVHQALNLGDTPAVVVASFVQPKGAMITIPVASLQSPGPTLPPARPTTGDGNCAEDPSSCE
jgi:quercetin dioxygenase-like cupin family protein